MIDFHCHLDLLPAPEEAAAEIDRAGTYLLSVTTTPKAFPKTRQIAKGRRRIRTALGLHPQLVGERHGEVDLFLRLLGETAYVGEIGLDGGDEHARTLDLQREVFDRVLRACSDAGGRILSIHSRHASGEVIECLAREPLAGTAILHWFSGSAEHAEKAAAMGAWFSVGLPMLQTRRAASLLSKMPRDRVLTETDAPFTSGNGRTYPSATLTETVARLAKLWGRDEADTQNILDANLRRLGHVRPNFGAPPTSPSSRLAGNQST